MKTGCYIVEYRGRSIRIWNERPGGRVLWSIGGDAPDGNAATIREAMDAAKSAVDDLGPKVCTNCRKRKPPRGFNMCDRCREICRKRYRRRYARLDWRAIKGVR